jgi:mono/diheme cytochrome c family protein
MKSRVWFAGFAAGMVAGLVLWVAAFLVVGALGAVNLGATTKPGVLERTFAPWVVDNSRERRAPTGTDSYTNEAAVATGLDHYRENCLICHGAPNVQPNALAKGLNPSAPELQSSDTQAMSDGDLFWTIKHGIRMTGMPAFEPTHTDEQIWKIVSFVRHMPNLTTEETAELRKASEKDTHPVTQAQ